MTNMNVPLNLSARRAPTPSSLWAYTPPVWKNRLKCRTGKWRIQLNVEASHKTFVNTELNKQSARICFNSYHAGLKQKYRGYDSPANQTVAIQGRQRINTLNARFRFAKAGIPTEESLRVVPNLQVAHFRFCNFSVAYFSGMYRFHKFATTSTCKMVTDVLNHYITQVLTRSAVYVWWNNKWKNEHAIKSALKCSKLRTICQQ